MPKWHVHREFAELFLDQPPQPIGWVLKDDQGRYHCGSGADGTPPEERGIWIVLDKQDAEDEAARLNANQA